MLHVYAVHHLHVSAWLLTYMHIWIYIYVYIHIHTYSCVYTCSYTNMNELPPQGLDFGNIEVPSLELSSYLDSRRSGAAKKGIQTYSSVLRLSDKAVYDNHSREGRCIEHLIYVRPLRTLYVHLTCLGPMYAPTLSTLCPKTKVR